MLAGDTTKLKLTDMARSAMLQALDTWKYSRTFRGGLTVKKELIVTYLNYITNMQCKSVDPDSFAMSFTCPPRQDEYLRSGVEPILIQAIENPSTLETKILDEDGRVRRRDRPNGNVYKVIRIVRGNEDIGSLFDVRMSAFDKMQSNEHIQNS